MKFSIRDLLLVTVIVALAVAWWLDRRAQVRRIDELEKAASVFNLGDTDLDLPLLPFSSQPPRTGR